jgi:o-succinylbenzoate synthase
MRIAQVRCTAFRVPFRVPFVTAHGTIAAREGLLLRLATVDGLIGLGEGSSVPGFGGSLPEIAARLRSLAPQLIGQDLDVLEETIQALDVADPSQAAVAFALDTALFDLRSQAAGVPLAALLGCEANRSVPVNATIGAASTEHAVVAARAAVSAGFRCLKLKVGAGGSEADEVSRIEAVREAIGPEPRLRLDANGAWQVEEAIRILKAVEHTKLEYVEQPVAAGDLAGMVRVRGSVATRVAADEAVGGIEQARRVLDAGAADVLVIKPMLAGGLRRSLEIAAAARAAGLDAVITTTLDTGSGTAAALQIAACLPPPLLACGLATGPLLVDDLLVRSLPIVAGAMQVPQIPGLGVTPDEGRLASYACGSWELGR